MYTQCIGDFFVCTNLLSKSRKLIEFERRHHPKFGYRYFKQRTIIEAGHQISAAHFAYFRRKIAKGCILVTFSCLQHRLHPDDTLAFNLPQLPISILDNPMAAQQLHRESAPVLNQNMIAKQKLQLAGIGVFRQVLRFDADRNSVGSQYFHTRMCLRY